MARYSDEIIEIALHIGHFYVECMDGDYLEAARFLSFVDIKDIHFLTLKDGRTTRDLCIICKHPESIRGIQNDSVNQLLVYLNKNHNISSISLIKYVDEDDISYYVIPDYYRDNY